MAFQIDYDTIYLVYYHVIIRMTFTLDQGLMMHD